MSPTDSRRPLQVQQQLLRVFALVAASISGDLWGDWKPPLSVIEHDRAVDVALGRDAQLNWQRTAKNLIPQTDGTTHPLGVQILLVELKELKTRSATDERVVEVFLFDYDRGDTRRKLIDVDTLEIVATTEIASAHLPLTDEEIQHGKNLMWQDTDVLKRIRAELSGVVDLSALQARVSVWVPGDVAQTGTSNCGHERCALVSLFTDGNYSLSVEPVINLMRGQVYTDLVQ